MIGALFPLFRRVAVPSVVVCCSTALLLLCILIVAIFNSTIPVDVIRVKSYVDSLLDPTCVLGGISINKHDFVPDRIVAGLMGVFRTCGGLSTGESYIPVVFFDPILHRSLCFPDRKLCHTPRESCRQRHLV